MWDVSLTVSPALWPDTTNSLVSYGKNGEWKEGRGEVCVKKVGGSAWLDMS